MGELIVKSQLGIRNCSPRESVESAEERVSLENITGTSNSGHDQLDIVSPL